MNGASSLLLLLVLYLRVDMAKPRTWSVAPMMKHTHGWQRAFMRLVSPGCSTFSEMVTPEMLLADPNYHLFQTILETGDVVNQPVLQLGGRDPALLAAAVKVAFSHERYPYRRFNLNVGCPSNTVATVNSFGCSLMLEPELTVACCEAMKEACDGLGEVSVKCRVGVDNQDSMEDLTRFVSTLHEKAGVDYFQIHARKGIRSLPAIKNRDVPPLNYDRVYEIARAFPQCRIEINGGIGSPPQAVEHLIKCPQLSGVMIGRAVVNHPYSFVGMEAALRSVAPTDSNTPTRGELLGRYMELVAASYYPRKGAPSSVARVISPVFSLFVGEDHGVSRRFQRTLTKLNSRGISNPALILSEGLKEVGSRALDSRACKSTEELLQEVPWLHLAKRSSAPLKAYII